MNAIEYDENPHPERHLWYSAKSEYYFFDKTFYLMPNGTEVIVSEATDLPDTYSIAFDDVVYLGIGKYLRNEDPNDYDFGPEDSFVEDTY